MLQNNIFILNFAEAPQPIYTERRGAGFIEYGEKNDYPNYLLSLFNDSAKHGAIIRSKVKYISGNGWSGTTQSFIDNPNQYESLTDLTRKITTDLEIFGGFYVEVIWSKLGGNIASICHIDYSKIRTNKDNTQFWYKEDWGSGNREKPEIIPAFNPKNRTGKQILFVKEYRPNLKAYSLPSYMGALNYIESDVQVSKHTLGNAMTGFSASKMITLPDGEPTDDEKREVERKFTNRFTGADGKKFILSFVNDASRKPIIDDLGSSDMTKEDFSKVDQMIQQNIFSAHELTSPSLFGIAVAGTLGSRTEMRDAYEIFKNTYVNYKQRLLESSMNMLVSFWMGGVGDLEIIPVEPISFELSEQSLMQIAPKQWLLEKAGIDVTQYQVPQDATTGGQSQSAVPTNDNVKNLTGRQHQQLLRIIRQYGQGKITREVAVTLLKTGLGLTDDDINTMLGMDEGEAEFSDHTEEQVLSMFAECGVPKSEYEILTSAKVQFKDQFLDVTITEELQKNVLELLKKNPLISNADIAFTLKIPIEEVQRIISTLSDLEVININPLTKERKLKEPISKIVDTPAVTSFEVKFSYDWDTARVPANERDPSTSRKFCKKLMAMDRLWTRKEIENLSARLGYSVWDRGGGWWGKSAKCRHTWVKNVIIKKKK